MADQSIMLKAGLHNVGSYQVSGIPFLTGALTIPASTSAPLELEFPSITQYIRIHNHDATTSFRIGLSVNGVKGTNYWLVDNEDPNGKKFPYAELRIKTNKIYLISHTSSSITGAAYVEAELTGIVPDFDLASIYSGSSGIG